MSFQFDPLVHRMVDKHGMLEEEARSLFVETKRYLYLCAKTGKPLVPSKDIDEMWHNFILFTMDYEEFCLQRLARFIHHRPRRRDDKEDGGNPIGMTLKLAQEHLGVLSKHWSFPGFSPVAACSCSSWCKCS